MINKLLLNRLAEMGHRCSLRVDHGLNDELYLNNGFLRFIRIITLVYPRLPYSIRGITSTSNLRKEIEKCLNSSYVIHPHSLLRFIWDTIMCVVLLACMIIVPMEFLSYVDVNYKSYMFSVCEVVIGIHMIIFILMNFNTSYIIKDSSFSAETDRWKIAQHYITTFFFLDLAVTIGLLVFSDVVSTLLTCLILFRFGTALNYLNHFLLLLKIGNEPINIIRYIVIGLIHIDWLSFMQLGVSYCQYIFFGAKKEDLWYVKLDFASLAFKEKVMCCLTRSVRFFGKLAFVDEMEESQGRAILLLDVIYQIFIQIYGTIFLGWMTGKIFETMKRDQSSTYNYLSAETHLKQYAKHKILPKPTRHRLLEFYVYSFRYKYFREDKILNAIPKNLHDDIILHFTKILLERIAFFSNLPNAIKANVVRKLQRTVYLKDDVISYTGQYGTGLKFISRGAAAVYTTNGREIFHRRAGEMLGVIAMCSEDGLEVTTAVALEPSEVFILLRADFQGVINLSPDMAELIVNLATTNLEIIKSMDHKFQQLQSTEIHLLMPGTIHL